MQWFKRWYHERFVSHSKIGAKTSNTSAKTKVSNHCASDNTQQQSINTDNDNQSSSYRCRCRPKSDTTIESITTTHTIVSNVQPNLIATTTSKLKQLSDKTSEHVNGTQSDDFKQLNCSNSTNLNVNGNGENGGTVSKSKDTRRQKVVIVKNSQFNNNNNINNSKIDYHSGESECDSGNRIDCSGVNNDRSTKCSINSNGAQHSDYSLKPNQRILHRRARELVNFITEIGENKNDLSEEKESAATKKLPETQTNYPVFEENFSDWVVVSLELERTYSYESRIDEDQSVFIDSVPQQYYTTSEYSYLDNSTIVTIHRCPSLISLSSSENDNAHKCRQHKSIADEQERDYGIFHSRNQTVRRILWFLKFLDFDIKTGTSTRTTAATTTASECIMKCTAFASSRRFFSTDSILSNINDITLNEPCCSNKMSKRNDLLAPPMMIHSSSRNSLPNMNPNSFAPISIPEYFGLNDYGDIIIHVDHIDEEKGFGFMMRRKKQVYRKVPYGQEVCEKKSSKTTVIKQFFNELYSALCDSCRGEYTQINVQST